MRYLVVGDVHGDLAFASRMTRHAKALGITKILQVGDFGIWDHTKQGVYFLDTLNENAAASRLGEEVTWHFVDGNHENHDRLLEYADNSDGTVEGFVPIRERILHIPRGLKWEWDGVSFMGVGGAHSIDKAHRKEGVSWWAGETLKSYDLYRVKESGQADVLLTHDCPTSAPFRQRLKNDPESHIHRQTMDDVGKMVRPKIWFHGHMHDHYDYYFPPYESFSRVVGLECNEGAMFQTRKPADDYHHHVVFDTDGFQVIYHPTKGLVVGD